MEREEALHELRSFIGQLTDGCREALETLIPELKSDDERIRKWLIDYFKNVGNTWIHREISPEQILSYLEKQKDHFREDTKMVEQKPAEWSEEDESMHTRIMGVLGKCLIGELPKECKEELNWLRDLPTRFNLQLKQEWSEEDESELTAVIYCVSRAIKASKDENERNSLLSAKNWLQDKLSFRVQSLRPSWKPSEEQLEAARYVSQFDYGGYKSALISLYEQLKQL